MLVNVKWKKDIFKSKKKRKEDLNILNQLPCGIIT